MIDGNQVKTALNERAEEVCRHLFPAGHLDRDEWVIGNIEGEAGESLRIHLTGDKAGVYADFKDLGVRGGNLLELWTQKRGDDYRLAFEEAKNWLGAGDDGKWKRARPVSASGDGLKEPVKPAKPLAEMYVPAVEGGKVWQFLTVEKKVSKEAVRVFGIGESTDGNYVVWPYFDAEGVLKRLKFQRLENNPEETGIYRGEVQNESLFGVHAIPKEAKEIAIAQSELDALSLWDYKIDAVALPNGAEQGRKEAHKWIEHDYDWLEAFERITLALDCDEQGQRATLAIAPRLGRHRCRVMTMPNAKGYASACLIAGVEPDVMMNAFGESRNLDPEQLKSPSDFRDPVWEAYYPSGGEEPGYPLPFGEFKPLPFRFRPSEVTVWQGYTKHGKTVCLHFCLAWLAWRYGVKSLTASLEIPAARTIQNMGRQILGKEKPADDAEYDKLLAWMDRFFWIYDHVGTVDIESMLDVFAYTAKKYGVEHFVVDSLMRLDLDEEDNDQQKRLLNRLCAFAKEFDVHIHLVAHSKKPDAKHPEEKCWPSKYSVRGSAHIVDLAHNTLCVWRNKEKEKQKHIALETPPSPSREEDLRTLEEMNDALILVQAQRGGNGDEPIRQLWFDQQRSWQYRGEPDGNVLNMLCPWGGKKEHGQPRTNMNTQAQQQSHRVVDGWHIPVQSNTNTQAKQQTFDKGGKEVYLP